MAESGSGQEKTEEPTSKKIEESKREGQIARSRELSTFVTMIAASLGLLFFGEQIIKGLTEIMHTSFTIERKHIFADKLLMQNFWESMIHILFYLAPIYAVFVISAFVAPLSMGGWNFSGKSLIPKLNKMDPIKGLKKMFGVKGLVELFKAFLKFLLIASVGVFILYTKFDEFMTLSNREYTQSLAYIGHELIWLLLILSSTLILIAMIDVPFQLWDHKRQLKMTMQEVKDERKESEGNPEVKGKQRGIQIEAAMQRMMEAIQHADVVVTNPSHFSVALKYDQLKMRAPIVVATGVDLIALQIRRVADANDVPILRAPPLARALYYSTEINQEIPAGLYLAVAQVLAYIYQLNQYKVYGGVEPKPSDDYPVPDDLKK